MKIVNSEIPIPLLRYGVNLYLYTRELQKPTTEVVEIHKLLTFVVLCCDSVYLLVYYEINIYTISAAVLSLISFLFLSRGNYHQKNITKAYPTKVVVIETVFFLFVSVF